MTIRKLIRNWGWLVAGTCLSVASVGRAQPASYARLEPPPATPCGR